MVANNAYPNDIDQPTRHPQLPLRQNRQPDNRQKPKHAHPMDLLQQSEANRQHQTDPAQSRTGVGYQTEDEIRRPRQPHGKRKTPYRKPKKFMCGMHRANTIALYGDEKRFLYI